MLNINVFILNSILLGVINIIYTAYIYIYYIITIIMPNDDIPLENIIYNIYIY